MDRVKMKELAREAMRKHYWKCVLVSLVFYTATFAAIYFISYGSSFGFGYSFSTGIGLLGAYFDEGNVEMGALVSFGVVSVMFLLIGLCLMGTGIAGKAFLVNTIEVGCKKFMCNSLEGDEAKLGDMGFAFSSGYKNIAKIMFVRDVYIGLWTVLWMGIYTIVGMALMFGGLYLSDYINNVFTEVIAVIWIFIVVLLVYVVCMLCYIPIYIKTLHYMFIPYILVENPEMERKQAFALSRQMIEGSKWDVFSMHMSFMGWLILSGCTCYILHFLYVAPYMEYTTAAYYNALKQKTEGNL